MIKKAFSGSIFIFLCIIIIVFFSFALIVNVQKLEESYSEVSNYNTENMISIGERAGEDILEKKEYFEFFESIKQKEDIILKISGGDVGFENFMSNVGIYFNGKVNNLYNVLEGRFFNADDLNSTDKLVVVGKEVLNKCIYEDGERYLLREKGKFKVIGVVGKEDFQTQYDDIIIYNLNSLIYDIRDVNFLNWKLDSVVYGAEELKSIVEEYDNSKLLQGYVLEEDTTALEKALKNNEDTIISFALIIITVFLALIQAILYWVNSLKIEIGVRKSYGASNNNIIVQLLKRYYLVTITAATVAIIGVKVIVETFSIKLLMFQFNMETLVSVAVLLIILGVVPLTSIIYIIKNFTIIDMLKEGSS